MEIKKLLITENYVIFIKKELIWRSNENENENEKEK